MRKLFQAPRLIEEARLAKLTLAPGVSSQPTPPPPLPCNQDPLCD